MTTIPPTARAREQPGGDEEAGAELNLGEFQHVPSLSLSEARLLITVVMDKRKERVAREEQRYIKDTEYVWSL
jgi:DNA-directed RNA polymerase II subunit RPB4